MVPAFLRVDEVLEIHRDQLERYGGTAGLRDPGLLLSALAQPQATFGGEFLHPDLLMMAAAYLFHIVQNHPFVDANKRVGAVTAIVFLSLNGIELQADEQGLEQITLATARGEANKEQIASFFRAVALP